MVAKKEFLIWSDYDLDLNDWREDLLDECPNASEDELYRLMREENAESLNFARDDLNIQLNRSILVIADLDLWNGHRSAYKIIESGNIKNCLYSNYDYATWFVDELGDLRCRDYHHDGTNEYLYRVFKDDASDTQIENLLDKIYRGIATRTDITRITSRLGDWIANVYGWDIPRKKKVAV